MKSLYCEAPKTVNQSVEGKDFSRLLFTFYVFFLFCFKSRMCKLFSTFDFLCAAPPHDAVYFLCPQGNMQRCKLVMDQVTEARDTMMKVLDHKDKVLKLLNKNGAVKKSSKLKRKERA